MNPRNHQHVYDFCDRLYTSLYIHPTFISLSLTKYYNSQHASNKISLYFLSCSFSQLLPLCLYLTSHLSFSIPSHCVLFSTLILRLITHFFHLQCLDSSFHHFLLPSFFNPFNSSFYSSFSLHHTPLPSTLTLYFLTIFDRLHTLTLHATTFFVSLPPFFSPSSPSKCFPIITFSSFPPPPICPSTPSLQFTQPFLSTYPPSSMPPPTAYYL